MSEFDAATRFEIKRTSQAQQRLQEALLLSQEIQEEMAEYRQEIDSIDQYQSHTENSPASHTESQQRSNPQPQAAKKKKKKTRNWSHDEIMALITIWEQNDVLYNVTHANYYDNNIKKNAMERMVSQLAERNINVTTDEASAKMHSLRVYFGNQRNKLNDSKKSGAGANEVYTVTWPYFQPLMFLNDNLTSRHTTSNLKRVYNEDAIPASKKSLKKIREAESSKSDELMNEALDVLKNNRTVNNAEKDADDLFFEMLSKQFKKIPDSQRKELLKLEIHRLVITSMAPAASNFNQINNLQANYGPPTAPAASNFNQMNNPQANCGSPMAPMHAPPTNQYFNNSRRSSSSSMSSFGSP